MPKKKKNGLLKSGDFNSAEGHSLGTDHGCQRCPQIGSNCPKMVEIRNFFRSDFSTFLLGEPKCTEIVSEKVPDFSHFLKI